MKKQNEKWNVLSVDLANRPGLCSGTIPSLLEISKLFEDGIENFKHSMGLTNEYIAAKKKSTVALETSLCVHRWQFNDSLLIKTRASKFDGRKVLMQQMICSKGQTLVTQTTLSISFDILKRKSCFFEKKIALNYKRFIDF